LIVDVVFSTEEVTAESEQSETRGRARGCYRKNGTGILFMRHAFLALRNKKETDDPSNPFQLRGWPISESLSGEWVSRDL
jgi:hypothetical protein